MIPPIVSKNPCRPIHRLPENIILYMMIILKKTAHSSIKALLSPENPGIDEKIRKKRAKTSMAIFLFNIILNVAPLHIYIKKTIQVDTKRLNMSSAEMMVYTANTDTDIILTEFSKVRTP
jgi:anaerobic C4-dicarboxylate transporter